MSEELCPRCGSRLGWNLNCNLCSMSRETPDASLENMAFILTQKDRKEVGLGQRVVALERIVDMLVKAHPKILIELTKEPAPDDR